ncbi:MAG: glycosyltransferase family 39 protein, partial [Candidatus Bathyarchaeia archaeon]
MNNKEDLKLPLVIVTFLAVVWIFYVFANCTWIVAFQQAAGWLISPTISFRPMCVKGVPLAFLATIEILILGVISSNMLLGDEEDAIIKSVSMLGMGFGFAGFITLILAIFGNLYQTPLNLAILCMIAIFLLINTYLRRLDGLSPRNLLKINFSLGRFRRPANLEFCFVVGLAICVIFFFCFYHAIFTVITHWDAIVYHAVMSVFMYKYRAIPILAGPSIGIEMSANFPPLFPAIGAYYYIQINAVEDFYLKIISPIMGVLTVLTIYKIGGILAGKRCGLISALFLAMTPLFFRYSIYTTSYSTLVFYITASVLYLLQGLIKTQNRYWIVSGIFYGFALLTSYLALYLAPFFIIVFFYSLTKVKNDGKSCVGSFLLILSALTIGGAWYIRNWILLRNPVYPNGYTIFDGVNIDPLIIETTFRGIKTSAEWSFFGGVDTSSLIKIVTFVTYRTHFPSISLLTLLGIILLITCYKKSLFLLVLTWSVISSVFIFSGLTWSFPRHVAIALPGFALISSLPVMKVLENCEKYDLQAVNCCKDIFKRMKCLFIVRKSNLVRLALIQILLLAFLFPSLTFVMGGKFWMDNLNDTPPCDYLWLLENPNADAWSVLLRLYPEALAWKWLNEHLKEGEKFATVENRIYYIKNCSNECFFYLDGWEARELYNMVNPYSILDFLRNNNVRYIIDVGWARAHGHFDILPLARFLGSPYFPLILDRAGNPNIYNVGPIETPLIANSSVLVSISQEGW